VHLLVRARMRPHALRPIDPLWVRRQMGRPRSARRFMARSTGATLEFRAATGSWPGGERLSAPGADSGGPVILYLHGGGYIACSPETHRSLAGSLAMRVQGQVYVPRYRLAPEHPYPAALDDAKAAYRHLLDDAGVSPR
jgi:acetyl esterase/lipase